MRTLLLLLGLCLTLASPAAAIELPSVRLAPRPELLIVRVTPAHGTHLAPDLPLRASVHDGYFTFEANEPAPPSSGEGRIRLPLIREKRIEGWTVSVEGAACADDGTTCQPFHVVAELPRGGLRALLTTQPGRLRPPDPAGPARAASPRELPPREDPRPPTQAASERPVILDFYATWCPPCDRLRDEFLEHPAWAEFLSGYDVRSIDADDPASFALKDRYRVGGYPTVLLTTPRGELLERIVGFPGSEEMARRLRDAPQTPVVADDADCAATLPALRLAVAREQHADAWTRLQERCTKEQLASASALHFAFDLASEVEDAEAAVAYALAALESESDIGRAAALAHAAGPMLQEAGRANEAMQLRASIVRLIDQSLTTELTADERISLADALYYRGKWDPNGGWYAQGAAMLAHAIAQRAGAEAGPMPDAVLALTVDLRHHEGLVHDLVYLLRAAGDHSAVGRLYRAMIALFPEAFTWHYAQAGWLLEQGAADKAEPAARAALEHSYGDMSLRAAHRLARVLVARDAPDDAILVIDEALKSPPPAEKHVRTWRYREQLIALRDELAPPGPR